MFLHLALRSRRDVLLSRQKARQIATLFHFQPQDQICIAAGAFAIAAEALRHSRSAMLCIQVDNSALHIFSRLKGTAQKTAGRAPRLRAGSLRLVKPLPASRPELATEDLTWVVEQLNHHLPQGIFEEIEQQNREVLALLSALRTAQTKIERLASKQLTPSAA